MIICSKIHNIRGKLRLWFLPAVLILVLSCHPRRKEPESPKAPGKEEMAELNRYLVQKDREIIRNYIERKGLKMTESPGGLWYYIEDEGSGDFLTDKDKISFSYDCSLLDGTKCYSSQTLGPKETVLGKSDLEPGLNEGLRLLKRGGRGIFILPPFLAYGFVGDGKKIPPRSIIVYELQVLPQK